MYGNSFNKNTINLMLIILTLLLSGCALQSRRKSEWIGSYKRQVFIACVTSSNLKLVENDISESINFDVIGNTILAEGAARLGQSYHKLIQPSKISDFEGERPIMNYCLM